MMSIRLGAVVFVLSASQACRSTSTPVQDADVGAPLNSVAAPVLADVDASASSYRRVTIAGHEAVIVPEALAADHLQPVLFDRTGEPPLRRSAVAGGRPVTGYFSPDDACLERLEAGLEAFLKKSAPAGLASKQRSYKRQYAGFRTDRPQVYATFLCRELHAWEWTSRPYHARSIAGGGDCYFDVVFGCEDGRFSDFVRSDDSRGDE